MDDIDPKQLIELVKSRDCLWDKSSVRHRDTVTRSLAWMDICRILKPDFDDLEKKDRNVFVKEIIKKWTNIRDAWRKSVSIKPDDKRYQRSYIYQNRLKFLRKNLSFKNKKNSNDEKEMSEEESDASESVPSESNRPAKVMKTEQAEEEPEESMIQIMDIQNVSNEEVRNTSNEDAHTLFIKSLLPTLNKLNEDETLEFQMGVIKILRNIRNNRTQCDPITVHNKPSSSLEVFNIKQDYD